MKNRLGSTRSYRMAIFAEIVLLQDAKFMSVETQARGPICRTIEIQSMEPQHTRQIPLEPRPTGSQVPLTAWQSRLWTNALKRGTRPSKMRMCAPSARVLGPLNIALLRKTLEAVVHRHESLRTRIVPVDRIPRQHVDPCGEYHLDTIDLTRAPALNVAKEVARLAQAFINRKIDASTGPLFEVKLLCLSEHEHVLLVAIDHLFCDAVSFAIFSRDLWTSYNQAAQGLSVSLPELPVQFADYAVWQQRTYDSWLQEHGAYWKARLAGAPRLQLPAVSSPTDDGYPPLSMLHVPISKTLSTSLRELAKQHRTLLPLVFMTIYVVGASHWCKQRDLVLLFLSHGRHRQPKLENMVGFLANRLHLRIQISDDDSLLDLLHRIDEEFQSSYQHQDFDRVPDLVPECLPELFFNWIPGNWTRRSVDPETRAAGSLRVLPFAIPFGRDREVEALPFTAISCFDTAAGIMMNVQYRPELFSPSTIDQFGKNLLLFAEELARRPLARITSVAALS